MVAPEKGKNSFSHLPIDKVRQFIDEVVIPCCEQYFEQNQLQHSVPSHRAAELKARAKGVEQQESFGQRGLKNYTLHKLQREGLADAWEEMKSRIEDPSYDLEEFEGAFLVANAKNLKADFKITGSLYGAMTKYEDTLRTIFDFDLMETMIHDVARESCGLNPTPNQLHPTMHEERTVYLWKTCCLETQHRKLQRTLFNGRLGQRSVYHSGFLRDAAAMTLVPPKKSQAYHGGWRYGQWYPSSKEVIDANANYTFSRKDLLDLSIDPGQYTARVKREKRGNVRHRGFIEKSFIASKQRTRQCYADYIKWSLGARVELRLLHAAFLALKEEARVNEQKKTLAEKYEDHPSSLWAIATSNWFEFILGNLDKFITALEIRRIICQVTGIMKEESKFMAIMIKCIQRFISCEPSRDAILWYRVEPGPHGNKRGLGFKETMQRFGYGFFEPDLVDFEALVIRPAITSEMVRIDQHLSRWYVGAGRLIQDATSVLMVCLPYLTDPRANHPGRSAARQLSYHLCLREYRRDMITAMKKEFIHFQDPDFDMDAIRFTQQDLSPALYDQPYLVRGNHTKAATPDQLFEWLWGFTEHASYSRTHFQDRPFRIMLDRIRTSLMRIRRELFDEWYAGLKVEFFKYHWLIPYPDGNGTTMSKTNKKVKARSWWSGIRVANESGWAWGRQKSTPGNPPPYPATLTMDVDEVTLYLQQL
jgi:hypothetical protein